MNVHFDDYEGHVTVIDSQYCRPRFAAIFMIEQKGRVAFFETGTRSSFPLVLEALESKGLSPDAVDYVIVSHVHLDHAGGAGVMLDAFHGAKLVVHPRGVRHMVDPSKLIAGTKAVYGQDEMKRAFGDILPIPEERIAAAPDGLVLELAGRPLRVVDSPGHARHHICLFDEPNRYLFTGDAMGISFRELDGPAGPTLVITPAPTQFDPPVLHSTLDVLMGLKPSRLFLTHYGPVDATRELLSRLHEQVDQFVVIARGAAELSGEARHKALHEGVRRMMIEIAAANRVPLSPAEVERAMAYDIQMDALGLAAWLDRRNR